MITFTSANALIAAAQARNIYVGARSLREDVAVELAQAVGEQVVCSFQAGTVGSASFTETSAQTTARTARDTAIAKDFPGKTRPFHNR